MSANEPSGSRAMILLSDGRNDPLVDEQGNSTGVFTADDVVREVGQTAINVLNEQARRIEEFRSIMILTLVALGLMTVGLVLLGLRLQRMVQALRESEERIRYRANYDSLTNLPNRSNFIEHLTEAIERSQRLPGQIALLFIDLDRFKTINDTLGHDIGDELIKQVAAQVGGKGGGRADMAQAGGNDPAGLDAALAGVTGWVETQLSQGTGAR